MNVSLSISLSNYTRSVRCCLHGRKTDNRKKRGGECDIKSLPGVGGQRRLLAIAAATVMFFLEDDTSVLLVSSPRRCSLVDEVVRDDVAVMSPNFADAGETVSFVAELVGVSDG